MVNKVQLYYGYKPITEGKYQAYLKQKQKARDMHKIIKMMCLIKCLKKNDLPLPNYSTLLFLGIVPDKQASYGYDGNLSGSQFWK